MKRTSSKIALAALVVLALPRVADAHTLPGMTGLLHGLTHPFSGVDHLLAMIAVGLWAAQIGGRARWAIPASFVGAMVLGGIAAMFAAPLPGVESGIAASILVLGLLIATSAKLPDWCAMGLVGLFAVFHGSAHAAEMPAGASALLFSSGFVLSTAALHAVGIAAGSVGRRVGGGAGLRLAGAAIAACGVVIWSRILGA